MTFLHLNFIIRSSKRMAHLCCLVILDREVMCFWDTYPLLMGCLSLAVWREGERGKKGGGK